MTNASGNPNPNPHDPFVECALMGLDLAAEHHLANCPDCQSERNDLEGALRRFSAEVRGETSRPAAFWDMQAARIDEARRSRVAPSLAARALSAGAMAAVLALAMLQGGSKGRPAASPSETVSDQELLVEVERAVGGGTPLALEPAALMMEENSNRTLPNHSASKEQPIHEN
jgi:hypothetical protein